MSHWSNDQYVTSRALNAYLPRVALKRLAEPRTNTTVVSPDGDLRMVLPPGLWDVTIHLSWERPSSSAAPGIRTRWFWPAGVDSSTPRWVRGTTTTASDPTDTAMRLNVGALSTTVTYASEVFSTQPWTGGLERSFVDLADGGEIGLSWAQHTANAVSNYIAAGSWLRAEPLDIY